MFSKSLIQFSVDGWGRVPSLLFTWGQTMVEVMKIIGISFKRFHTCTSTLSAPTLPQDTADPGLCQRLWTLMGNSGSVSMGSLLLSPGSLFCLCPPRVYFPVLCKFWRLYGGVNGDLLQEGLCHTQVCCPRAPAPATGHC